MKPFLSEQERFEGGFINPRSILLLTSHTQPPLGLLVVKPDPGAAGANILQSGLLVVLWHPVGVDVAPWTEASHGEVDLLLPQAHTVEDLSLLNFTLPSQPSWSPVPDDIGQVTCYMSI